MGVNYCRCFDTLRTKVGQIPENINSSSSDHRIGFLLFQLREDGRDKENKVLGCEDHRDEKQRILHCEFPQFTLPSNKSMKNVISSFSNKTCSLDPIPTHVIKDNISSVLPMVSGIVRQSFSNGIFPTSLKTSLVRPKLKKPILNLIY